MLRGLLSRQRQELLFWIYWSLLPHSCICCWVISGQLHILMDQHRAEPDFLRIPVRGRNIDFIPFSKALAAFQTLFYSWKRKNNNRPTRQECQQFTEGNRRIIFAECHQHCSNKAEQQHPVLHSDMHVVKCVYLC